MRLPVVRRMAARTTFEKLFPRARRSGVDSNLRSVSGRAFGPMKGLQPMVRVIATESTANSPIRIMPRIFAMRLMEIVPLIQVNRCFNCGFKIGTEVYHRRVSWGIGGRIRRSAQRTNVVLLLNS